ncbi:MAG: hypothetical protein HKO65_05830 [Gemmatimonadetes bacterium]|nr:hypothetical protein [Gemmatimonadota bacterium]NNM04605.1 hypothetical protein [Gemmatimonadota bacterium]
MKNPPIKPVEFYDAPHFWWGWFLMSVLGIVAFQLSGALGMMGLIVFAPHAVYSLQRLIRRKVRIRISPKGILEKNFWYSPGFIPWDQVLGVRKSRFGMIEIEVKNPQALLEKQTPLAELVMRRNRFRGMGLVAVLPWGLEATRTELIDAFEHGLGQYALQEVRRGKALDQGSEA